MKCWSTFRRWLAARRWLVGWKDPHRTYAGLTQAAILAGITVLRVPMPMLSWPGPGKRFLSLLFAHWVMARRIRRKSGPLIVREFLTIPALLTLPWWWSQRQRVLLLINHNLQTAHRRWWERVALRCMRSTGVRFLILEDVDAWHLALGGPVRPARVHCIPFPLPEMDHPVIKVHADPPWVGFIGAFRPEKNPGWALDLIAAACQDHRLSARLLVGTPDAAFRTQWDGRALTVDTTSSAAFEDALARCSVIVCPYEADGYRFRHSGLVQDALRHATAVVTPDHPVMRHQIMAPVPVGACFSHADALVTAVVAALTFAQSDQAADEFARHVVAKSPSRIAALLKDFA